ncbi:MAG: collagen-like protein, partial [Bacteroidota bacterium]
MKNLLILFSLFVLGLSSLIGQAPQSLQYQAVARDANGDCLSDASISIRFSIRDSATTGPILYQEQHVGVQTNAQGLFSLLIGADNSLATGGGQT